LTFEDTSVLHEYASSQMQLPVKMKIKDGRTIYASHDDFGPLKSMGSYPMIADFDTATRGEADHPLLKPIQPDAFRAPEVTLGIGWSYSADIWNFGVLVCHLIMSGEMIVSPQWCYRCGT
jgi:serine/threonine-protein kinase SRPK3